MKKIKTQALILLSFVLISVSASAQQYQFLWDKTLGGASRDWNCQIVTAADGSVFLVGDSQSDIGGNKSVPLCNVSGTSHSDIWILKADTAGNILWQKNLGAESDERNPQLLPLNNASKQLLLTCHSVSNAACDKSAPNWDTIPLLSADYWVCLLDSSGNKIWDVTIGGENFDDFTQAGRFTSGDILISGESNSPVSGDKTVPNYTISNDLWSVRLDAAGNKIWDKVHGGDGAEFLTSVIMLPNDEFVLAGSTSSDISGDVSQNGQGSFDYWMIKVDGAGNKIWDKRFGGSSGDRCLSAKHTADNGFILCGYTVSPQGGDISEPAKGLQDIWIVKTDDNGNKEWDKRYGGTNGTIGTYIENGPDNGYWISGYTDSQASTDISQPSYGGSDYWILLTDSVGNKVFDKRFGGSGNEFSTSFSVINDSALFLFGYSDTGYSVVKTDTSQGWFDYWMVKFEYTDTTTTGIQDLISASASINIAPNPSEGHFTVIVDDENFKVVELMVTDITGNVIWRNVIPEGDYRKAWNIDLSEISSGMYFFTLTNFNGNKVSTKVILN